MEGPYAEFTGYFAGDRSPKPTIRVTAITHRNDPILRGTIEGCMPGSYSENAMISSIFRSSTAWNVLDRAGVPGIVDVWGPPVQAGINLNIAIKQSYRGQAKQAANALWGSSAAHVRYKHVTVVDDDIDIHDYAAVDWAIAYRVNAGEDDIVIMPATFGLGLDPSTRKRDRDPTLFGTGKWNRVLIDATINLDYDPDPDFGGSRYPPTVWPSKEDEEAARTRWKELGLDKLKRDELGVVDQRSSSRRRSTVGASMRGIRGCPAQRPTHRLGEAGGERHAGRNRHHSVRRAEALRHRARARRPEGRREARRLPGAAWLRQQQELRQRDDARPRCSASSAMSRCASTCAAAATARASSAASSASSRSRTPATR